MIEFGVHGRSDHAEGISVIGRCFAGPIRVGSIFCRMRRYLNEGQRTEIELDLEVVEIQAYGRKVDAIDEGLTGLLVLNGSAPDALGDGWALVG